MLPDEGGEEEAKEEEVMRKRTARDENGQMLGCTKCGKTPAFRKKGQRTLCGEHGKGYADVVSTAGPMHPNLYNHFRVE